MVEDLIRQFVPEVWVEKLDFSTLQRVTPSFISSELEDQPEELWEICLRDGSPVYIYLFIEHRPEVDHFLAIHLMANVALLYQALIRKEKLTSDGRLPLIVPVVLHHGETEPKDLLDLIAGIDATTEGCVPRLRCKLINEGSLPLNDLENCQSATAQIFFMERTRDWEALRQSAHRLGSLIVHPEDGFLRKALLEWLDDMMIARWQEQREKERHEGQENFYAAPTRAQVRAAGPPNLSASAERRFRAAARLGHEDSHG